MKKYNNNEKDLQEMAKQYFQNDDIAYLENDKYEFLKNKVKKNNVKKTKWYIFPLFNIATICSILCIVLPITLVTPYYTYTDLVRNELTLQETQTYIEKNYPKYSFVFDDFNIIVTYGKFAENNLYILGIQGSKIEIPYTYLDFVLVLNKSIEYPDEKLYTTDATIVKYEDFTLYKKIIGEFNTSEMFALLEYNNYDLYLHLNINDEELFNKFL